MILKKGRSIADYATKITHNLPIAGPSEVGQGSTFSPLWASPCTVPGVALASLEPLVF